MCEVIKKINEDSGFDRALSFIFFQKWLDIALASADEWPISANDDSKCIIRELRSACFNRNSDYFKAQNPWHLRRGPTSAKRHFHHWK